MDAVKEKYGEHNHTVTASNSRSESRSSERTLLNLSDTEMDEKTRNADVEKQTMNGVPSSPVVVTKDHVAPDPMARPKMFAWMFVNTLATVFIVRPSSTDRMNGVLYLRPQQRHHTMLCTTHSSGLMFARIPSLPFPRSRSSATKPSFPTHPSANVKPPSPPSISS